MHNRLLTLKSVVLAALLCLPVMAQAVHVPMEAGWPRAGWTLPDAQPLQGLENWRLQGVFAAADGGGWALLSIDGEPPLRVEDQAELPGGVRVVGVDAQGVWLQRGRAQAYLRLAGVAAPARQTSMPQAPQTQVASLPAVCSNPSGDLELAEELATVGLCPTASAIP